MASGNYLWQCSSLLNFSDESMNYDCCNRKLKRIYRCEFNHCPGVGARKFCLYTSAIRERIFLSFLLSIALLVISNNGLKTVSAFEYPKSSTMIDNIDKDSDSIDYDDYVDDIPVEPSTEAGHINREDTHLNSYHNLTQTRSMEPEEDTAQNGEEKNPSEIQKAVCTITAGEVKASAEAVTTKTLKGVCGSAELQLAVSNLESKIFKELASIRTLLLQLIPSQEHQPSRCDCVQETSTPIKNAVDENTPSKLLTPTTTLFKSVAAPGKKFLPHPNVEAKSNDENAMFPKLKSLQTQHVAQSRDKEVSKFNNTMLADRDFKIFTYYWRVENFTAHIESGHSVNIDSPRFAIKGKPLQLKAYFQHLHRDFLFLQLEYATSTPTAKGGTSNRSNSNNIMLDMGLLGGGSLFKAISNNDQILFKYKISILDQQNLRSSKDLTSQEFHNLEGGFLVPNSALLGSLYIKNDTLLIQLFLYL